MVISKPFCQLTRLHISPFKRDAIKGNNDVLVCSPGGVGTTKLISFIGNYKSVNSHYDKDLLKHLDRPPLTLNHNLKAIYVFGNPFDIVISLFRRNFHHHQSLKLLFNYDDIEPVTLESDLEQYLRQGEDKFKLENHFDNWRNTKVSYPIMMINYDYLWEQKTLESMFDFLEIPKTAIKDFPPKKARVSNYEALPQDLRNILLDMYGSLYQKIQNFGAFQIIPAKIPHFLELPRYYLHRTALAKPITSSTTRDKD